MSKPISKSLQHYVSKLKKPSHPQTLSSLNGILKGCRHLRTQSITSGRDQHTADHDHQATLADVDRFLLKDFKSLYVKDEEDHEKVREKGKLEEKDDKILFESPKLMDVPPPNLCGTNRFFVPTGSSGSLMEEARSSITTSDDMVSASCSCSAATATTSEDSAAAKLMSGEAKKAMGPDNFIALFTYSPNPHDDFKHSMTEMIKMRSDYFGKVDWEFMEELLFCYLNLNDKKSYKYILSAFVDLAVVLRENSGKLPTGSRRFQSTGDGRK